MTDLIFPLVNFGRADNATYDSDVYLGAECLMSLNLFVAEQGLEIYSDFVDEDIGVIVNTALGTISLTVA